MSDAITFARPYATAVFESALVSNGLTIWHDWLAKLALVTSDTGFSRVANNPTVDAKKIIELIESIVPAENAEQKNFLTLVVESKRLFMLPQLFVLFERLKGEYEKSMDVEIESAKPLNDEQKASLITALERRLNRKVMPTYSVNETILGGAIIRAGDLVIDGSGRGQLSRLASHLEGNEVCN